MMGSFRCEKKRCDVNVNCTKVTKVECAQGYENINGICKGIVSIAELLDWSL